MAINPMEMMKMKQRLDTFNREHPKVLPFLNAAAQHAQTGTVIEMKVTDPNGEEIRSNIRLTDDDLETLRSLMNLQG